MFSPFVEQWVKSPWFQLSGFAVGLLGVVVAVVIWLVTRRYKRIWYDVRSFTLVERERSTVPGLQVFFEKKLVDALTISKVCIWNSGKDALRQGDLAPRQPLRVSVVKPDIEILEASLIQTSLKDSTCKLARTGQSSFGVEFDFLDPNHGWVFQIAHTGAASEDVKVAGHIVGGGRISRPQPLSFLRHLPGKGLRPKTHKGRRLFSMWVMGIGGVFMIASSWGPGVQMGPRALGRIVPFFLGLSYLLLAWTMYRIRPPKGLERYEDEFQGAAFTNGSYKFPDAPQFASRKEAAEWVIAQTQAFAKKFKATFQTKIISDHEIDLDLKKFWLTLDQIAQIISFGERNGFKMSIHGESHNPFIPPEFYKQD